MEWSKLLLDKTFRSRSPLKDFDGRDPFENDYGRIISSPFIRRLQDKTQVFPLEESDFIRTRLTHSLEVSSIARSLGKTVQKKLIADGELDVKYQGYIPSLLSLAGLVHDLGNPPYGHFGEAAIQRFFKEYFSDIKNYDKEAWTEQQKQDFIKFDGNVQTFRILRKLSLLNDEFSYNVTFPTLASIIKYPRSSVSGNKGKTDNIAEKKFGFFVTEQDDYQKISDELGLEGNRHPVVFLLEAADDIAYSAADLEDGARLGSLDYEAIYSVFKDELNGDDRKDKILMQLDRFHNDAKKCPSDRLDLTVKNFRIFTQSIMIEDAVNEFFANYEAIMEGTYGDEIITNSASKNIRQAFKKLGGIVFENKRVIQAELAGWQVIQGLLREFVAASKSPEFARTGKNSFESRLYKMISSSFRYMYEDMPSIYNSDNQEYRRFQLITDFISGMTDSYALNYYHKLAGIKV